MSFVRIVLACFAVCLLPTALSGCAMGGGVFGTTISGDATTTRIKTSSAGVGTSGVKAGSTDTIVTTY
jgi:hypothetical protein